MQSEVAQPRSCEWCRYRRDTYEPATIIGAATHVAVVGCWRGHQRILGLCEPCAERARDRLIRDGSNRYTCSTCARAHGEHRDIGRSVPGLHFARGGWSPEAQIVYVAPEWEWPLAAPWFAIGYLR